MRKNFGQKTWMYPMPVLMIGTYDENRKANLMNAAWGGIYDYNHVVLSLSAGHKTTQNIKLKGAFTISFADAPHMAACDYVGLVSAIRFPISWKRQDLPQKKVRLWMLQSSVSCRWHWNANW